MPYKDLEKIKEHSKKYYQTHKQQRQAYDKKHRNKRSENEKAWYHQTRMKLLRLLAGEPIKCVICGFSDIRVLQLDHINGGGYKDRLKHGSNTSNYVYYLKHPEEAKKNLQILCANCNWIKRSELREN